MAEYDPPAGFSFAVSLAGTGSTDACFQEVSGLEAEQQTAPITEGSENRFVHHLPGANRPANLVLKRGILRTSDALFGWIRDTLEGGLATRIEPKTLTIMLLDPQQKPMIAWTAAGAWPVKLQIGNPGMADGTVSVETLECAYQGLSRETAAPRRM